MTFTFTIRISQRFSSVPWEFQMGNFQKYWSQNEGQDFTVLDFFHGWRTLKVDGRDGRDPQSREKHAPAGRFTCMKSSGGDTYTDQSCRETRSLHLPEWFLPWVVEKQGPIIFYKHLGFPCRITNCLIGTVVSHIEEFFLLGLLSDN